MSKQQYLPFSRWVDKRIRDIRNLITAREIKQYVVPERWRNEIEWLEAVKYKKFFCDEIGEYNNELQ